MQDTERGRLQKQITELNNRLADRAAERDRVLGLFRRGRIDDATLDLQLDQVDREAAAIQSDIETARRQLVAGDRTAQLQSAESLLGLLRKRLEGPIPSDLKRRIVEILVDRVEANTIERWGVEQSEITITYRFSEPDEPAALVLPRSHRLRLHKQPLEELNTIGDHLLRRRLALKLLQRQVAEQIGVDKCSIGNWESGRSQSGIQYMPAIIRFLGYDPLPPANGWSDRLVRSRTVLGICQFEAARRIGVDQCTLARWERGERKPNGKYARKAAILFKTVEAASAEIAKSA